MRTGPPRYLKLGFLCFDYLEWCISMLHISSYKKKIVLVAKFAQTVTAHLKVFAFFLTIL